jgi:hypothetical protein
MGRRLRITIRQGERQVGDASQLLKRFFAALYELIVSSGRSTWLQGSRGLEGPSVSKT